MKYLIIMCLIFWSCTDDRSLDPEDFEARPTFEVNVFQTQYAAELINAGNDSIPVSNTLRDYIDVDFLNEQFNADYLVGLTFKVLAGNSINRRQNLNFIFYDNNDVETYRVSEPIAAGTEDQPTVESFSVVLNAQEIAIITSSVRAEFFVRQASTATNSGRMQVECIVEASYLYTGE